MSRSLENLQQFFQELKRRNVYRVAATYAVVAFVGFQTAKLLIPSTVLPAWTDEFFLFLLIIGFPIAVVVAWAFELTPDGVRRTGHAGAGEGNVPTALVVVGGLALVGVSLGAGWYLTGEDGSDGADRSVAVLPFSSVGGEEGAQLALGVHDDLLTRLSTVSDLRVISRTSVERYGGTEMTVPQIARELDVRWVVEGGVQQADGAIRVNAQLIDGWRDDHRWAETYERELTAAGLFSIQEDLTRRIARSLQATLSSGEEKRVARRPTEDLEAYRLYLRGRDQLDRRTEGGMRRGLEFFQRAVEHDSSFALAWSGIADALGRLSGYGYESPDSLLSRAHDAARRAVELEPDLAEARASLAMVHVERREIAQAFGHMARAVALRPSYGAAWVWLAELEGALGRREAALAHARRAVSVDPNAPLNHLVLGWTNWWIGGPEGEALSHIRRAKELQPDLAVAHTDEGVLLSDAGRHDEALTAFKRALPLTLEGTFEWRLTLGAMGVAFARIGQVERSRELVARLEQEGDAPFWEAMIHAALGDESEAFRALKAVNWTLVEGWDLLVMSVFDPLRDDPRYAAILRERNRQWGLNADGSLPDSVAEIRAP